MSNTSTSSGSLISLGFFGALTLIFITLKLCNVIDWSWWWVTSPSWISFSLTITGAVWWAIAEVKAGDQRTKAMEEYNKLHPQKKSKFMERLDEAMKESEARRKQNQSPPL